MIQNRKEVHWESPPREDRFEDDVRANEDTFQQALRAKMAKYEFYYGPYQRPKKNEVTKSLDLNADQCIKDRLTADKLQSLLTSETVIAIPEKKINRRLGSYRYKNKSVIRKGASKA